MGSICTLSNTHAHTTKQLNLSPSNGHPVQGDEDVFAAAVCSVDGQRASFGEADAKFVIGDLASLFVYLQALDKVGADAIHDVVGWGASELPIDSLDLDSVGPLPLEPARLCVGGGGCVCVRSCVCVCLCACLGMRLVLADLFVA